MNRLNSDNKKKYERNFGKKARILAVINSQNSIESAIKMLI